MADVPQTLALLTLAQEYRGGIVRQINRRTTLLRTLPIVRGEGKNVSVVPESSGANAENYSDGADQSNYGSDAQAAGTLAWGLYRGAFRVTKLAQDGAATSRTPAGNQRLLARNLVNGSAALADLIEDDLFNGAGTGTLIAGLDVAIGDDTNVYAGIDRSTSAYWQPYVEDPGSATALTFAQIRTDLGAIYDQCGEVPNMATCSTAVFNTLAGLFDTNRRWVTEVDMPGRGVVKLNSGEAIDFEGCMFFRSSKATANQIYYLNTDYVRVETLPDARLLAMESALQEMGMSVTPNDGFGDVPLDMFYEKLAKTGASSKGVVYSTCQLVVDKPNACGVRKNVA